MKGDEEINITESWLSAAQANGTLAIQSGPQNYYIYLYIYALGAGNR